MDSITLKDSRVPEHIFHASTNSSMQALDFLKDSGFLPETILDIGAGSGILSFYAHKIWSDARILAGDISRLAVEEMQENIIRNDLHPHISCIQTDGLDHPVIQQAVSYQLIIANLLAKFHVRFIRDIEQALANEGKVILAGILISPMLEVQQAIEHSNLRIIHYNDINGWVALVLEKRGYV